MEIIKQLAQELKLQSKQVEQTVHLLDEGNTIPFIARYRKEATGELDEVVLRNLEERLSYLRNLKARKEEITRLITEQEKLTEELAQSINAATSLQELEDIYRPFRPKRRTRASMAREKGLEPLATALWEQPDKLDIPDLAAKYLNDEVSTIEEALKGAQDILAEEIADDAKIRQMIRAYVYNNGILTTKDQADEDNKDAQEFQMYFSYEEPVRKLPPHRILAINRGERLSVLKVKIELDSDQVVTSIEKQVVTKKRSPAYDYLLETISDSWHRLLLPSIEREIRNQLTEKAEEHAISIFAKNLRSLLLQPPVRGLNILGVDPAFRTGCKVVVINQYGDVLTTTTIYPHEPQKQWDKSFSLLKEYVDKYEIGLITIGNGTASRETEQLVAEVIKAKSSVKYLVVNEAGASVYSASKLAREEFPDLDVAMRGAVSIARRVLDPLAELVKIEPKAIGVGLYQHDVNQKELAKSLSNVVEDCVNYVGVELNSASAPLLQYVAGLSNRVAKEIVAHRQTNGIFTKRNQLKDVKGLGPKAFQQCAGFLRIREGQDPLDNTPVHPESYHLAAEILESIGFTTKDLADKDTLKEIQRKLARLDAKSLAEQLSAGQPTVRDILKALAQPGRDPRDELPPPLFRADVLTIEDLKPGMVLKGTVQNVVDFGAFVDIGVKKAGLVHISKMSNDYIKHPTDVLQVGDIVEVKVLDIDLGTQRISLSMKD